MQRDETRSAEAAMDIVKHWARTRFHTAAQVLVVCMLIVGTSIFVIVRQEITNANAVVTGRLYFTIVQWWLLMIMAFLLATGVVGGLIAQRHWAHKNRLVDATLTLLLFPVWSYTWNVFWIGLSLATVAVAGAEGSKIGASMALEFFTERVEHTLNALLLLLLAIALKPVLSNLLLRQYVTLQIYYAFHHTMILFLTGMWYCIVQPAIGYAIYVLFFDVEAVYGINSGIGNLITRDWIVFILLNVVGVAHTLVLFYFMTHTSDASKHRIL